ncbi:MAG: thiamine phosphate synthase [Formivibrio sp.]|nr:thiamine phosphate synthase [Formivibrio sp.]
MRHLVRLFPSGTKPLARRASLELITMARAEFNVHIVAIGGITLLNAAEVLAAGTNSIAVITALFDSPNASKNNHDI